MALEGEKIYVRCPECNRGSICLKTGVLVGDEHYRTEYGYCNYCYMIPDPGWIATVEDSSELHITKEESIQGSRKAFEYDADIRPPIPYLYNVQAWHDRFSYCIDMMFKRYGHTQKVGVVE